MGFCVAQFPRPNSFGGWSHARTQLRPDFLRRTALFTEVRVSMRRYVAAALFLITLPHVTPASAYNDPLGRGLMDFVNVLSPKSCPGTLWLGTEDLRLGQSSCPRVSAVCIMCSATNEPSSMALVWAGTGSRGRAPRP